VGLEQHIVRTTCSEETFFGLAAIFRYLFKGHATVPRRDNTLRLKTSMAFRVPILDGARDVIVGLTTMAGGVRGRLGMLSKPMPGQGECL